MGRLGFPVLPGSGEERGGGFESINIREGFVSANGLDAGEAECEAGIVAGGAVDRIEGDF